MYDLINRHIQIILQSIPQAYVTEYDWLIQNLQQISGAQYQVNYRKYWGMNAARLSPAYCDTYFQELQAALTNSPTLRDLVTKLHQVPTHGNARQSLQFSFATKLLHTVDRQTPIYDSFVAAFYFFQPPESTLPVQQRVSDLVGFHDFLSSEYARILANGLLARSILAFRSQYRQQHFTDVKVIDLLIWAYVDLLNRKGLINRQIAYS
jgi:hypothetical protein